MFRCRQDISKTKIIDRTITYPKQIGITCECVHSKIMVIIKFAFFTSHLCHSSVTVLVNIAIPAMSAVVTKNDGIKYESEFHV
jgi:hypothetical protein